MSKLIRITENHIIYFKIYSKLNRNDIMNLYCSCVQFKDSLYDYINAKFTEQDWLLISTEEDLYYCDDFLLDFSDKIYWNKVSKRHQELSEKFIMKFQDYLDWDLISIYQVLTEKFMSEFREKINWTFIAMYQQLSETFIQEFNDRLDSETLYFRDLI